MSVDELMSMNPDKKGKFYHFQLKQNISNEIVKSNHFEKRILLTIANWNQEFQSPMCQKHTSQHEWINYDTCPN